MNYKEYLKENKRALFYLGKPPQKGFQQSQEPPPASKEKIAREKGFVKVFPAHAGMNRGDNILLTLELHLPR